MNGRQFAAFRQQHGLSQAQVGRLLYVSESTVYQWEVGKIPVADYAQAWALRLSPALCDVGNRMTAEGFCWHLTHRGWTQADIGRACGYNPQHSSRWARGVDRVPGLVADYLRAQPQYPRSRRYYPSASGLRRLLTREYIKPIEFAAFCGVSESAVLFWCDGLRPLPPAVRAWMRAGCPWTWRWRPPGLEPNIMVGHGKPLRVSAVRPIRSNRYCPSRIWTGKPKRRARNGKDATWPLKVPA